MDLVIIKQILNLAGIKNLAIRFDTQAKQIDATFTKGNELRTAHITFAEVEGMFTQLPSQPAAGSPVDEPDK